jgi:hypothetical protein
LSRIAAVRRLNRLVKKVTIEIKSANELSEKGKDAAGRKEGM